MEKKCRVEGTKFLRRDGDPNYPEQLEFFMSKGFEVKIEFLRHEKELTQNEYKLPEGYVFRSLKHEDLSILEEVSRNDPLRKGPFVAVDWEQYMNNIATYDPDSVIVVEKDGIVVGFFGCVIPPDPNIERVFSGDFGGVVVHGDHQEIESFVIKEIENRAYMKGKKKMDPTFFPNSPRLAPFRNHGYKQYNHIFQLEKSL